MPIHKGPGSVSKNMKELIKGSIGKSRRKAIHTLAKRKGLSFKEARMYQARAIALNAAKKK